VPITGSTREECFSRFFIHLRDLLSKTVETATPFLEMQEGKSRSVVSFRENGPATAEIKTRFGKLYLYVAQALEAEEQGREAGSKGERFRLRTVQYWYRLQAAPGIHEPALIRWEYDTHTPRHRQCRHHVQFESSLRVGKKKLDMNKLHLPSGWVTVEEVIRFLIHDLDAHPPCGAKWPQVLIKSERAFYEDFTSKRYTPPK
jgi:hypothetical protein